jgi:Ca-activated chloride channel homolog
VFTHPLGFLALLAIPAIVALHYFRRRFSPQVVSALFLWSDEDRTPLSGRKREKLRNSVSLWSEIAAALCLALVLAGPRGCQGTAGTHLVVVLDGAASMDARAKSGETLRERAIAEVARRIDALGRGSRVTIVASGVRPKVLVGPAAFPEEARQALAAFTPTALHHEATSAVALALQLSGGGAVVLVTDRYRPDDLPPEIEIAAIGEPLENLGIVRASRDAVAGGASELNGASGPGAGERLFVTVASFSATRRETEISAVLPLDKDRVVLAPQKIALEPLERKNLSFALPRDAGPIEVRLGADALAIDDRAYLAPRPKRTVTIRSNLSEEASRELGLAASGGSNIARWLALCDDVAEAHEDGAAHILLSDRPAGSGSTWTLEFAANGTERKDFIGPFLAEKRHAILEGTTLEGIVWSADPKVNLVGVPLVSAGNLPLFVEDRVDARRRYVIALDPKRSSLQRSPDWPILLSNLVEERRRELPGASNTNLLVGEELTWRAAIDAADTAPYVVLGAHSRREIAPRSTLVVDGFDAPGFYALKRSDALLAQIGVSFVDAAESDLRTLGSGHRAARNAASDAEPAESWIEIALFAAVVALLAIDWVVLARPELLFERGAAREAS